MIYPINQKNKETLTQKHFSQISNHTCFLSLIFDVTLISFITPETESSNQTTKDNLLLLYQIIRRRRNNKSVF